jgi:hypothetical protein
MKTKTYVTVLFVMLAMLALPLGGTASASAQPPDPAPGFDQAPRLAIISAYARN